MPTEVRAKAILRNLNITPRKVRQVSNLLQGQHVEQALASLTMTKSRSAKPLAKLVQSAIANAKNKQMNPNKLVVQSVRVNQGRTLKRTLPRARGRATLIRKQFSHITIELAEKAVTAPGYLLPKKIKKTKGHLPGARPASKPKEPKEETRVKSKSGFLQRVFRRKAI